MKFIPLIALVFSATQLCGQDLLDDMARAACSCLESKNMSDNYEKLKFEAGMCILAYYQEHTDEVNEYFGITEFNGVTGRIVGEKLGVKMVTVCPDLVIKLGQSKISDDEDEDDRASTYTISGKVAKAEGADLITYHIKADDGKTYKVVWYRNFEGSEDLVDDPKSIVGKKVTVTVEDVECYIPKAKGYYSVREIRKLKKS